jgi:hypothetical protein
MSDQIKEKLKMKIAISQIKNEEEKAMNKKEKFVLKNIGIAACILMSLTGVVFAGSKVIEKVFKEPKKYESYNELLEEYRQIQGSQEVTQEDETKAVDMEQAVAEANKVLNKFGYESQNFAVKELKKNYILGANLAYCFATNKDLNKGIQVDINAENGKCVGICDKNLWNKKIITDPISKEEAIEKSEEIYKLFGLKEDEYKLKQIEGGPEAKYDGENPNTWNITYAKTYDGAFNYFERIEMYFGIKDDKLLLYSVYVKNEHVEFNNNEIVISKEDAKKIALEEDKKITDNDVDFTIINLEIRQVNSWIYLLEQNGGKYPDFKQEKLEDGTTVTYPQYRTVENRARKVWTVNIHYKKGKPDSNNEKKYNTKSIFVDVTTGEIIGGADESYWEEKN